MACTNGARGFLVAFNFIFWLSGAALLGIGVWLSLDDNVHTFFEVIHVDTADPYFKYSAYILVGFGSFIFVVGFVGCCGALRRNKALLAMYIFFLVVVMAGELTAGILTALYKNDIEAQLQSHLTEEVTVKYSDPQHGYLTKALDTIQSQVKCCGVNGPQDYEISYWKNNTAKPEENVPEVCCRLQSSKDSMNSNGGISEKDRISCQASAYSPDGSDSVYSQGCYKSILEWFREHSVIVIGVGCGIAGLQLFGLLFAICMCCDSQKEETYEE